MSEQNPYPSNQPPYPYYGAPMSAQPNEGHALIGFIISLLLHLFQIPMIVVTYLFNEEIPLMLILFVGVSQLLYMIPAVIIAFMKGKKQTAKGIIIGAAIVFLLNAACTGFFYYAMSGTSFH
ncbi:MAG: hypothetical protein AB1757_07670 [Acidobacteriota bacterium]